MTFRRTGYCDLKLIAKFIADKFNKIGCIIEVSTCCCLTKRNISTKRKHMVYAFSQILFQLLFDAFFCILDYCEVCYRSGSCILDHLAYFSVCADISAAGTVCTGNILRFILHEMFNGSRQICHAFFCLWWKKLKRKQHFFSHCFR